MILGGHWQEINWPFPAPSHSTLLSLGPIKSRKHENHFQSSFTETVDIALCSSSSLAFGNGAHSGLSVSSATDLIPIRYQVNMAGGSLSISSVLIARLHLIYTRVHGAS